MLTSSAATEPTRTPPLPGNGQRVILFKPDHTIIHDPPDWQAALNSPTDIVWIDLTGPDPDGIRLMREFLKFHPLAVEDTINGNQRSKLEEYADQLFLIANILIPDGHELEVHELDIFAGKNYLVTVHKLPEVLVDHTLQRLSHPAMRMPITVAYLLYMLMDTLVDSFFPILEHFGVHIEELEDDILRHPRRENLGALATLKRSLRLMWQVVWPQQNVLAYLTHPQQTIIDLHSLEYYFRDVHDHLLRIAEIANTLRDTLTSVMDLYMSSVSNRLNQVVNRLTVLTLIIGSLTVISGFYGMNFEVTWPMYNAREGIFFVMGLMITVTVVLYLLFKRLRWL